MKPSPLTPKVFHRRHKPKAYHRRIDGPAGGRPGYPAIFLGQGVLTKLLVEILSLEPVAPQRLPEAGKLSAPQLNTNLRRLVAQGLVKRYSEPHHPSRKWLTINREHAYYAHLRALLASIATANGLHIPKDPPALPGLTEYNEWVTYELGANLRIDRSDTREIFGHRGKAIFTLFGRPNRTRAILLVGAVGTLDQTSIADGIGVKANQEVLVVLHPIEDDDIFECEVSGWFNMYRLRPEPWLPELAELITTIVDSEPGLRSQACALATASRSGKRRSGPRKVGFVRLSPT